MISNITIGQFYPVKSKIHNLDPRIKLISVIVFVVMLFVSNSYLSYIFAFISLGIVCKMSNVPFKVLARSLKTIMFLIIFTFILNSCFSGLGTPFFEFGIIRVSKESLIMASKISLRLIIIILASSLLTFTTSAIKLTDGLEYLFKPLKIFKFPAHDVAMMMTIALRFIPTLIEELDKIMKAQKARGANFDTGSIISRSKNLIPVLVPLFVSSFRRADDLAMAMESRCYRGDIGRTRMNKLKLSKNDYIYIFSLIIFCVIMYFLG